LQRFSNQGKAYLFAISAILLWSTIPTAFKIGLRHQDNYQLLFGASLVSLGALFLIILVSGRTQNLRSIRWHDLGFSALMGLLNPLAYYLVLFKAYAILPAQVAQPLNMIWPIVLVIISIPMLKQRIRLVTILAMLVSFSGVALISVQGGSVQKHPENSLGIILALSSSVVWALYWIFNVKDRQDKLIRLFFNFLFATIYLCLGGFFVHPILPDSLDAWLPAIYVGLFEMGITFVLWLKALELSSTTDRVSNLVYIAPFVNLVFANQILKEEIFVTTVFGIILLVSGILIQNLSKGHEKNL
jgi:drug/metabolite transporter (DMT)-like permease